ncbi:condensation domain-containing protein [Nocardia sp. NPDC052566]|uniref:condensation domain-containing protein n=1 Tax=Nocardia sp. NPDC052566 TaxID=3364330 RepID=UPI0037CB53BA
MEREDRDIAIVGIGVRFPDAEDLTQFRANLWAGRDSIAPMSEPRAQRTGVDPRAARRPAGYLDDVSTFDHEFFGLSKHEASLTDPQQRLALVVAERAIAEAGYAPSVLRAVDTAVVFASSPAPLYGAAAGAHPLGMLGSAGFGAAARIAHLLGLTGPCYAVDSGCNAGLLAVHHACRELRLGTAEYALAGGVSVRAFGIGAGEEAGFDELVSGDGRVRAFDIAADGTVVGEGGAAVLLTTVERAIADGAPIHAVLRGSATVHNGRAAATISAPSARAQAKVIAAAWRDAGLPLESAGYLEAHGSGTRLGDAVELEAIAATFTGRAGAPLAIGSVKTNIGHLDHAAGIAGLVKAVLAVEHGELYPSLHFERPTGGMDLAAAGIEVLTGPRHWPQRYAVRRAGVSSFSLGGMNAHCVVEQPPRQRSWASTWPGRTRMIGVSARTDEALARLCTELAGALRGSDLALDDVVRTLNDGRDHHARRIALTVTGVDDLADQLTARSTAIPAPASGRIPKVVLLLSPDAEVSGGVALPPELPAHGAVAELLGAQLAFHDELRMHGVGIAAVLGAGVSRYLARHLAGAGEQVGADELAAAAADHTFDADRLIAVAKELLADGPVLFAETLPGGSLGALLATVLADDEDAEIICPPTVCNGPAEVLARLYEHGADLNFALAGLESGRRVRLPGHPLSGAHCWVDITWQHSDSAPAAAVVANIDDPVEWLRTTVGSLVDVDREIASDDDFFALGGNSILALQLLDRITAAFGVRPKLIDVYEYPTIAEFAAFLTTGTIAPTTGLPPIVPQDEWVISFGQARMWFHHQLDPDTTLYNLPIVIRLAGAVEVDAIRGTFADLAQRHEVVRSNFVDADGVPALRIRPDLGDFFRFADVSTTPEPIAAARDLVAEAGRVRFDLATDPLLRVLLIRLSADEHVLQITMHHSVNDGGTPQIVRHELPELYRARMEGREPNLAPLPVQYRDYARWQRDLLAGNALDGELRYWIDRLTGAPRLDLPLDKVRPPRKTFAGALHIFEISVDDLAALRLLCQRESVSIFVVLLSAFHLMLARYSGRSDIVIGTPTTGRNRPELAGLIGYFNSTVALRVDIDGAPGVGEWLRSVRSVVLDALEHQEIPFDHVVQALGGERDLSRTPIFDVCQIHQELPAGNRDAEAVTDFFDQHRTVANLFPGMPLGTAKFDLTLLTIDHGDRSVMDACIEYSTDLFVEATVADMARAYLRILRELADADPARPIHEILAPAVDSPRLDYRALLVPADRPRPAEPRYTAARVRRDAVWSATSDLDAIVLAAWAMVLGWYSGEDEIDIDVAVTGGYHPVRVDLTDDPTPRELFARTGQLTRDGAAARLPVRYLGGHAAASSDGTTAELALSVDASDSHVALRLDYATELFDEPTAHTLLADLHRMLDGVLREPDRPVADVAQDAIARDIAELEQSAAQ